jgi:hypothetical protein
MDDGAKVILITRPRRFGKTLNLSMLSYFLDCNQNKKTNLFKNLAITEDKDFCKNHQNKYPIIFISFKDIRKGSFVEAYPQIVNLISDLYQKHRYLLEEDLLYNNEKDLFNDIILERASQTHIEKALISLCEYLMRKFNQLPIILIDEYDTPIQEAYLKGYYLEMVDLMRSILGQTLKDSKIQKAVVTGITRVAQESLFSGVNNFIVYSSLRQEYGQYFGLTESEVLKLIGQSEQNIEINDIKSWYNGYQIGKYILYNPWSIINCLKNQGKLEPYWLNTSSNDLIRQLLTDASPIIKQQFQRLLQQEEVEQPLLENLVFPDLKKKAGALWSLLLYAGYLNILSTERKGHLLMAKIAIPNKEVMYIYDEIIEQWFSDTVSLESYIIFTQSLSKGNLEVFKRHLASYLMQSGSYFDFNNNTSEQIFHIFVLGLVVGLKDEYIIQSNQESGKGRFDVIFIPKDKKLNGILLEFKIAKTSNELLNKANEALAQIKDKQYFQIFRQYGTLSILAIGIAFCGKEVELAYENIELG